MYKRQLINFPKSARRCYLTPLSGEVNLLLVATTLQRVLTDSPRQFIAIVACFWTWADSISTQRRQNPRLIKEDAMVGDGESVLSYNIFFRLPQTTTVPASFTNTGTDTAFLVPIYNWLYEQGTLYTPHDKSVSLTSSTNLTNCWNFLFDLKIILTPRRLSNLTIRSVTPWT